MVGDDSVTTLGYISEAASVSGTERVVKTFASGSLFSGVVGVSIVLVAWSFSWRARPQFPQKLASTGRSALQKTHRSIMLSSPKAFFSVLERLFITLPALTQEMTKICFH